MEKQMNQAARAFLRKQKRRKVWQRAVTVMAALVVFCTTYALILPAITMTSQPNCGLEEHTHTEDCYTEEAVLSCGQEESEGHTHTEDCYTETEALLCGQEESEGHTHTEDCYTETEVLLCGQEESESHTHTGDCYGTVRALSCGQEESEGHTHTEDCYGTVRALSCGQEESEGHTHTEDCYTIVSTLTCEIPEHTHTLACYADPNADVETAADWEATLPQELTGNWAEDLLAVAESQLGYTESTANYIVGDDGQTVRGYTRYGAWYGIPYGDWCAMYISFCLRYAGIPAEAFPIQASVPGWIAELESEDWNLYIPVDNSDPPAEAEADSAAPEPYIPKPGDLIFFDYEQDASADHVGIVTAYIPSDGQEKAQVKTIEGNSANRVQACTYDLDAAAICGYAILPENPDDLIMPLANETEDQGNTFTLTYNSYTITFYVVDSDGNAIPGDYSNKDITVTENGKYVLSGIAPEIAGYTYSGAEISTNTPVSYVYVGYDDEGNADVTFRFYSGDGKIYTRPLSNATNTDITLTYTPKNTFALNYTYTDTNGQEVASTVTFHVVDGDGKAITGDYSKYNITAEDATLYKFSEIAPEIDGYTYSGAKYRNDTVVSVATNGFTNEGGTVTTSFQEAFQIYMNDPIVSGKWFSKNSDTVTLTYIKDITLDGGSFVIINQSGTTNYALTSTSTTVNGVDGLASETVTLNTDGQVTKLDATEWTFEKVPDADDQYYVYTVIGGEKRYLTLGATAYDDSNDGKGSLTISSKPQAITAVVSGNTVVLHAGNNSTVNLDGAQYDFWCYNDWDNPSANSQLLLAEKFPIGTVQGVTPTGTVINMFDYWAEYKGPAYDDDGKLIGGDYTSESDAKYLDTGINANHFLKFTVKQDEQTSGSANAWTGSAAPRQGIVQNQLVNDFPVLTEGMTSAAAGTNSPSTAESLAYLFDPNTACDYRKDYTNVGGLLMVDSAGYYYYDSQQNFAELNTATKQFTLYERGGVQPGGADPDLTGQFFPFNRFAEVNGVSSSSNYVNHYFGLAMTTRFVQRYDGRTSVDANAPHVTFEFAGDDDVWIFVDDVLVADLGGIHDRASVKIDFATGEIIINEDATDKNGDLLVKTTSLYAMFAAAGKENLVDGADVDGDGVKDIFANGTYHTLRFFFLERGNVDSNLHLKYNLASYPPSGVTKVNQYGDPVPGAEFKVYKATVDNDGTWKYNENASVYTGVTDAEGKMTFVDDDNMPYTMDELEDKFGTHFVLKETGVPDGYRLVNDEIHLHISNNVLLCENTWDSGVWADTNLLVSAPNTVKLASSTYNDKDTVNAAEDGKIFAVVLKYTGSDVGHASADNLNDEANWAPLYGTAATGFTIIDAATRRDKYSGSFVAAAIDAANQYVESENEFYLGSSGALEGTVYGMPGDVSKYYYMLPDEQKGQAEYTVAYYWTSANSMKEATVGNTYRVNADDETYSFDREFGATINVPNLVNDLYAQKFDDKGNRINGATFALYRVEEDENVEGTIYYLTDKGARISLSGAVYTSDPATGIITGTIKDENDEASTTFTIDPTTGIITETGMDEGDTGFIIKPYKVEKTMAADDADNKTKEDGTAIFSLVEQGTYYLREIAAPPGYELNETEVMVYITDNAVYANAGSENDGITVARGPGYIADPLNQFASFGDVNNTLTWVYEQMQITGVSNTFTAFNDGSGWAYLAENNTGTTVTDGQDPYTVHLIYANDESNKLFNYTVNTEWYTSKNTPDKTEYTAEQIAALTRRLYTTVGWSYYELYQDHSETHKKMAAARGATYEELGDKEIANLFSRAVFVQFTDERSFGNLEISKTVTPDETTTQFRFALSLTDPDDSTKALEGTYTYKLYDVTYDTDGKEVLRTPVQQTDANGGPLTDEEDDPVYVTGTITNGTANFTLTNNQVVVIENLPANTGYTVTETSGSDSTGTFGYTPQVSTNGAAAVEGAKTSGTLVWRADRRAAEPSENVRTVAYTNALLPLIKVLKVDGGNANKTLAGASFVLYYKETAEDGTETAHYYAGGAFPALAEGETETDYARTTPDSGQLLFAGLITGKTYYLKELSAPDGYNRLTQEIEIEVDADGKISVTGENAAEYKVTDCSKHGGQELDLTVKNTSGYELPETGGGGTLMYTAGGTAVCAAAAALYQYQRRRRAERRSKR